MRNDAETGQYAGDLGHIPTPEQQVTNAHRGRSLTPSPTRSELRESMLWVIGEVPGDTSDAPQDFTTTGFGTGKGDQPYPFGE